MGKTGDFLKNLPENTVRPLSLRIQTISAHLGLPVRETHDPATALEGLEVDLRAHFPNPDHSLAVFFFTVLGRYLSRPDFDRLLLLGSPKDETADLIEILRKELERFPSLLEDAESIEFVTVPTKTLVIDVTHTERYELISGIQRVVRRTCEELRDQNLPFILVRATRGADAFEPLSDAETAAFFSFTPQKRSSSRAFSRTETFLKGWTGFQTRPGNSPVKETLRSGYHITLAMLPGAVTHAAGQLARIRKQNQTRSFGPRKVILLLDRHLLLPELVDDRDRVDLYEQLKKHHSLTLGLIGYDLIPLLHPETVGPVDGFVHYLRLLRIADRVSCISETTRVQFGNFLTLIERKLEPKHLVTQSLAGDIPASQDVIAEKSADSIPLVVCLGTVEPRKNHLRVLKAASILWEKKRDFRLVFAGRYSWTNNGFLDELKAAQERGFPVEFINHPRESEIVELYRQCRFTVFCSLLEGFGLPVMESLCFGKPCVTSDVGSMREIASQGGCTLVNPLSPASIAAGIDRQLSDRGYYSQLIDEIAHRKPKSWRVYAGELYQFFSV